MYDYSKKENNIGLPIEYNYTLIFSENDVKIGNF
jgi:hypothetical protein